MNYADIKQYDIANGPGVRISLFVSGCTHHCKNCFNPEAWDFSYGEPFTGETEQRILDYLKPDYIAGLTLLGGEPFERENQKALLPFLRRVKAAYPEKSVWAFSGYLFDKEIVDKMCGAGGGTPWETTEELLSYVDVVVDGRFVDALKSVSLRFKGSSNQRTILVRESLKSLKKGGEVVLWDPPEYIEVDVKGQ